MNDFRYQAPTRYNFGRGAENKVGAEALAEGMTRVLEALDREGRIPNSDDIRWEDDLIERSLALRSYKIAE